MGRKLTTIQKDAVDVLRRYMSADDTDRTSILHSVATLLVEAREHFYKADGSVDWRGQTYPYRRFAGEVYSLANIPRDEIPTIQAAVRYHVSNVLRERLSPEELEAIGLLPEGARERSSAKRARQADLLSALSGGPIDEPDEILRAVNLIERLLSRIDTGAAKALDAEERRALRKALAEAEEDLEALGKAAGRRRP